MAETGRQGRNVPATKYYRYGVIAQRGILGFYFASLRRAYEHAKEVSAFRQKAIEVIDFRSGKKWTVVVHKKEGTDAAE